MIHSYPTNVETLDCFLFSHFEAKVVEVSDKSRLVGGSVHVVHYSGGRKFSGNDPQAFCRVVIKKIFCCSAINKIGLGSRPMF